MFQKHRSTLGRADPGVIKVDMNHQLLVIALPIFIWMNANQKWTASLDRRYITRIPPMLIQKQVLALVEPEQGDGLEKTIRAFAEKDGIFSLHKGEFRGKDQSQVDVVTKLGRVTGFDSQVFVRNVVKEYGIRHWGSRVGYLELFPMVRRVRQCSPTVFWGICINPETGSTSELRYHFRVKKKGRLNAAALPS